MNDAASALIALGVDAALEGEAAAFDALVSAAAALGDPRIGELLTTYETTRAALFTVVRGAVQLLGRLRNEPSSY